jgi:hypothetical protein
MTANPIFVNFKQFQPLLKFMTYPKPLFLVPPQQACLERTSKEIRHDIVPKLCKVARCMNFHVFQIQ